MAAGKIPIGGIILLALLSTAGYVGWSLAEPWFTYLRFKDEVVETVKLSHVLNERRFKERIYNAVDATGVWIEEPDEEIFIHVARGHATVRTAWTEFVFFPFDVEYSFDFQIDESNFSRFE